MNLLLIEDEVKTANALKKGLEENGYMVDVAYDGLAGLELLRKDKYQLVISDIIMPKLGGINLCREIRTREPGLPVLLLTALQTKDDIVAGFEAGADDYLSKPFDFRELLLRVRSLTRRMSGHLPEALMTFADITMNLDDKTVTRSGKSISLTAREFKLLEYFIRHHDKVVSRVDLAKDVWNIEFNTGTNVVEVYINYLRNKIDKPFEKKLIHNMHGMGYIMKEI